MTEVLSTLDRSRTLVAPALRAAVARLDPGCRLVASYHLGWCDAQGHPTTAGSSGKAVRPALAMLAAEAVRASPRVAIPGAVAVELTHNFSLLHDDLLDGDAERRHRPTAWTIWGTASAILTGDAMLALAHEMLLEADAHGARAAWELARVTRELTRGQVQDIAFEKRSDVTLAECLDMAAAKTGSLLAGSTAIGAILAGAPPESVEALRTFGAQFGLAYQLVDDVLGIWGDPATTGKPVFSDLRARKKTLPVCYAVSRGENDPELLGWLTGAGEPDPVALRRIADLLRERGAQDWAFREARARILKAEEALAVADLDEDARTELLALATFVLERQS